jgi:hypothetical protein
VNPPATVLGSPVAAAQPAAILELFAAHTNMVAQVNHIATQHGAGHPEFPQSFAAYGNALPRAGIGALIEQQFQQQQVNINNSITTAVNKAINNSIKTAVETAIQPMAAKVDALYADYTERHNTDALIINRAARAGLDPIKWLFNDDGEIPLLSGEPPRERPKLLRQLEALAEADLDDLNGGYGINPELLTDMPAVQRKDENWRS